MAGVNISNSNLLYIKYQNDIQETMNQEALSYTEAQQEKWTGAYIEGRLHTSRSSALGYTEDGGEFPTAKKQGYTAYKVARRFFHASIQLTGGVMAAAKKSPTVARDAVESEVRGMVKGTKKLANGMFFLDGTGVVATINAASGTELQLSTSILVWEDGEYDVYDSTLATHRGTVTVTDVEADFTSGNVVANLDATVPSGTTATDLLVWKGAVNRAVTGLETLIDDDTSGTFQGVTMSGVPRYTSLVLDNGGTARGISPKLLRQLMAGLYNKKGSKSGTNMVYANPDQVKEFEEMYEGSLRYSPNDKVSGRETTSFQSALGKVNYKTDSDCPKDKLFACDRSQLRRAVQKPLGWRLQGGQIFLRSDQSNVYTATMDEICEMYIKERHSSGRIDDLANDAATPF